MRRSIQRSLLASATVVLAACNLDVAQPVNAPSDPATESFASSLGIDISKMQRTPAGSYYREVNVGTGATLNLTPNGVVVVSYLALLKDGSLFAQADSRIVALSALPPGMADGIGGMKEGGERIIVVPSALGYGPVVVPGVPPNSTLVFDVLLKQLP